MGIVSCQCMSSGAAFVTNFCYVSVHLISSSVLLFYLCENPSSISKPPHNLTFHKLYRSSSSKSSTATHFLCPLNYFCVTLHLVTS